MLEKMLDIILKMMLIFMYVNSEKISKPNELRHLLADDVEKCMGGFNIHKDKIIRTQDSLKLGGKYIIEVEISERHDCLRLCCETESCDVFIYEEKRPGGCYLFHCGPPHDFKCKFTNHANYSSAVLMSFYYQENGDLRDHIQRNRQEFDLKSLKKKTDLASKKYAYTDSPFNQRVTLKQKAFVHTTQYPSKLHCNRNQYECLNSDDCIAIYNVCDGIPQCSDGSDEASELGCPTEKPTTLATMTQDSIVPVPEIFEYPVVTNTKIYSAENENARVKNVPLTKSSQVQSQRYNLDSNQGMKLDRKINIIQKTVSSDSENKPDNEATYHRSDHPPRFFQHEKSGFESEKTAESTHINQEISNPSHYPIKNYVLMLQSGLGVTASLSLPETNATANTIDSLNKKSFAPPWEQVITQFEPAVMKISEKQIARLDSGPSSEKRLEIQKNLHTKEQKEFGSTVRSQIEGTTIKTLELDDMKSNQVHFFTSMPLKNTTYDRYQKNMTLNGAVISLVFGLSFTTVLVGLIICRIRVVENRARRRHGSDDADYLVNGMYL